MKLLAFAAILHLATPALLQQIFGLWYDIAYDQSGNSLNNVACSTGQYGLITRGYKTFGDLPTFPFIGGAPQVASYDSPNCGSCWELMYTDTSGTTSSHTFMAINTAFQGGFSVSYAGMNILMNGNAMALDGVVIYRKST